MTDFSAHVPRWKREANVKAFLESFGGGTVNQVLTKDSGDDYDWSWQSVPAPSNIGTGNWNFVDGYADANNRLLQRDTDAATVQRERLWELDNNTQRSVLSLYRETNLSGAGADGIGTFMSNYVRNDLGDYDYIGGWGMIADDVTSTTVDSHFNVAVVDNNVSRIALEVYDGRISLYDGGTERARLSNLGLNLDPTETLNGLSITNVAGISDHGTGNPLISFVDFDLGGGVSNQFRIDLDMNLNDITDVGNIDADQYQIGGDSNTYIAQGSGGSDHLSVFTGGSEIAQFDAGGLDLLGNDIFNVTQLGIGGVAEASVALHLFETGLSRPIQIIENSDAGTQGGAFRFRKRNGSSPPAAEADIGYLDWQAWDGAAWDIYARQWVDYVSATNARFRLQLWTDGALGEALRLQNQLCILNNNTGGMNFRMYANGIAGSEYANILWSSTEQSLSINAQSATDAIIDFNAVPNISSGTGGDSLYRYGISVDQDDVGALCAWRFYSHDSNDNIDHQFLAFNASSSNTGHATFCRNGGNVGIGTTNPVEALHIARAVSAGMMLQDTTGFADRRAWFVGLDNVADNTALEVRTMNDAGTFSELAMRWTRGNSGPEDVEFFNNAGSEWLRFDSSTLTISFDPGEILSGGSIDNVVSIQDDGSTSLIISAIDFDFGVGLDFNFRADLDMNGNDITNVLTIEADEYRIDGDTNTYIAQGSGGGDTLGFYTGGSERITLTSSALDFLGNDILNVGTLEIFDTGSEGAPTIYRSNDSNTGIYWPTADQIALTAGGLRRFLVGTDQVQMRNNVALRFGNVATTDGMVRGLKIKDGNTTRNNTSTFANDPDLQIAGAANQVYMLEGYVVVSINQASSHGGIKFRIQAPTGATVMNWCVSQAGLPTSASNIANSLLDEASELSAGTGPDQPNRTVNSLVNGSDIQFIIDGDAITAGHFYLFHFAARISMSSTAGNIILQHAQSTARAGATATVHGGSYFWCIEQP